jgi:hypothetical protein
MSLPQEHGNGEAKFGGKASRQLSVKLPRLQERNSTAQNLFSKIEMDQMEENELELESVVIESSVLDDDGVINNEKQPSAVSEEKSEKLVRFPLTRIKHLVKQDPDVNLCSQEALFIICKSTVC